MHVTCGLPSGLSVTRCATASDSSTARALSGTVTTASPFCTSRPATGSPAALPDANAREAALCQVGARAGARSRYRGRPLPPHEEENGRDHGREGRSALGGHLDAGRGQDPDDDDRERACEGRHRRVGVLLNGVGKVHWTFLLSARRTGEAPRVFPASAREREPEEASRLLHDLVAELEGAHVLYLERIGGTVEERHVRPLRLEGRPPAQAGGVRVAEEELGGVGLRPGSLARRHERRPQPLLREDAWLVQVDESDIVRKHTGGESKRETVAPEVGGLEPRAAQSLEALDDARDRRLRRVEAAVQLGIVVPAGPLEHAGKPRGAAPGGSRHICIPGEAPVEPHAYEPARSCWRAASSSIVSPIRMTSIGRRSRRWALTPKSHFSAVEGS